MFEYKKSQTSGPSSFKVMQSANLVEWTEFVPQPGTFTTEESGYPLMQSDLIRITLPNVNRTSLRLEVAE